MTAGDFISLCWKRSETIPKNAVETPQITQPDFHPAPGSTQHIFNDADSIFEILSERFGIEPAAFDGLRLLKKSGRDIYAAVADHRPPHLANCISGLPLFHMHFRFPKLTTCMRGHFRPYGRP